MEDAIVGVLILAWIVGGIVIVHRCRKSGLGTQIILMIFLTKGFFLYWVFFGLPSLLIRTGVAFYRGTKEGRGENQAESPAKNFLAGKKNDTEEDTE